MPEIVINLHMHTCFSDGTGTHEEIAEAALKAGLDAVIITDHNVFVKGPEGYYHNGKQRLLLLVGEDAFSRRHGLIWPSEQVKSSPLFLEIWISS